ncbi:HD domain-containing protein [Zunongwangia sp. H14]|uniref:HD domain-containing protein n=1 Tax=Zunongwangia sp. H14 TaxID=3240792 RepID=UPI0035678345
MDNLIPEIKEYCYAILVNSRCGKFPFHNLQHTLEVVKFTCLISIYEDVSEHAQDLLKIAAWFHDTGYAECYKGHERKSEEKAKKIMAAQNFPLEDIQQVSQCIQATKMPQLPKGNLEKIICDADLAHLAAPDFYQKNQALRKEWEKVLNKRYNDKDWLRESIQLLSSHKYFTSYGANILQPAKNKNLYLLQEALG